MTRVYNEGNDHLHNQFNLMTMNEQLLKIKSSLVILIGDNPDQLD